MTADELIRQIKNNEEYWRGLAITPQQIDVLVNLSSDEYANVVSTLLQEPVADYTDLRGIEYARTYAHLIYGALLLCLHPIPDLYPTLLTGTLKIGDPSSIQYGASALRKIKPVEEIVSDLFEAAEEYQDNAEILSHIAWLFYWMGFSKKGTWGRHDITLVAKDGWIELYRNVAGPETNPQKAAGAARRVGTFMQAYY